MIGGRAAEAPVRDEKACCLCLLKKRLEGEAHSGRRCLARSVNGYAAPVSESREPFDTEEAHVKCHAHSFPLFTLSFGLFIACGGSSDGGADNSGSGGTAPSSAGTSASVAGTSSNPTGSGVSGSSSNTGGSISTGGNSSGAGGRPSMGGGFGAGGFMNSPDCPSAAPQDGSACTPAAAAGGGNGRGGVFCAYDTTFCSCRTRNGMGQGGGTAMPTWRCFDASGGFGQGGFGQGGFGQGGFGQGGFSRGGTGQGGSARGGTGGNGGNGGTQ